MKSTVIYHSADYDGIFCREIAKQFLGPGSENEPNEYIGWNFGDPPIEIPPGPRTLYVMDLPLDKPFGLSKPPEFPQGDIGIVWIDHHKSAIESHPTNIPGYRIDGVAACRLAWQWFTRHENPPWPERHNYVNREVLEPLAVRLAGEYDVWDKRDPRAELLQFGLRSAPLTPAGWSGLLSTHDILIDRLLEDGAVCQRYAQHVDTGHMHASFLVQWEGLKFLCLNGRGNSNTFASKDVPETGHDALLLFYFTGKLWLVRLYHAKHRTDLDLSKVAVKYGGGGHRGACGFTCHTPFFLYGENPPGLHCGCQRP